MAAIGRTADRSQAEPPPAVMWMHVNVLCRNKFIGPLLKFFVGYPQRVGEESGLNPLGAGQRRAHHHLLPGLDHRIHHRR